MGTIVLISKWETLESKKIANLYIFDAYIKQRKNPISDEIGNFTIIESPNWVNIIPITKDNKIVMIEQYRHGTDSIVLEIPGGLIEKDEDPMNAAKRECLEETGYSSEDEQPILTGISLPNPAYQNNQCYSYIWNNVTLNHKQNLDKHEIIQVYEFTPQEVKQKIINGQINHAIILTAFFFYSLRNGF